MTPHTDDHADAPTTFMEHMQTNAIYAPKMLEQYTLQIGRAVLGVLTAPLELALRAKLGTQTINLITYCVAWLVFQIVVLLGLAFETGGLIRMWGLYIAFIILTWYHFIRLLPKIRNPMLEEDGEDEGEPWRIFFWLPFAGPVTVRCLYEPVVLIVAALLLQTVGALSNVAMLYIVAIGLCHGLRSTLRVYELWMALRDILNGQNRARVMNDYLNGTLSHAKVRKMVMIATPANLPPIILEHALKTALEPEFEKIKSPRAEPHAKPAE